MLTRRTLWERWLHNAQVRPDQEAIVHWSAGRAPFRWTWSRLTAEAEARAGRLFAAGMRKGDVCALIMRHHKDFYPIYMAVESLGAIPAVLQYPNSRIHPEKFRQGLEGMARHSGLDWILTERELREALAPSLAAAGRAIKGIHFPLEPGPAAPPDEWKAAREDLSERDACLLQHSSGTTGLQKAVMLSHEAVLNHIDTYAKVLGVGMDDKIVSWLPLYHDMGLIAAFQMSLAMAVPLVQLDPFEWVSAPYMLLEAVSKEKGTLTWLPNFAFNLMTDRILDDERARISLDSWRMIINCSEPIRHESMEKFFQRYGARGLKRQALSSAYAMAETTFAVTQTTPGASPLEVMADREELLKGALKIVQDPSKAKICVSSGTAIEGCEVRIVGDDGADLADGRVGELLIRSAFMFGGYRNNPAQTSQALDEGFYRSGDLGFRHRGNYFVIGRKKDTIIVGGRGLFPEDVEDAVSSVEGVIAGRVVAYGEYDDDLGTEQVHVIAESAVTGMEEQRKLRASVLAAAAAIDVTIRKLYLVPRRWLIKSSSGKLSRKANRERMLRAGSAPGETDDI